MAQLLERWKGWARQLQLEAYALYLAYRDPRVPWYARVFAACVVGYAFSPIDLIPDAIPVLGYVDDLVLIPLGVRLALAMIPADVMAESRDKAREFVCRGKPVHQATAVAVATIWLLLAAFVVALIVRVVKG